MLCWPFFVGQKTAWNFFFKGVFVGSKISSVDVYIIYNTTGLFVIKMR